MKVIVVGAGWAGCAAGLSARKQGAEVHLLERTDMLLGTGLVGGIMRNNGRFTAAEEMLAMRGGELFGSVYFERMKQKSLYSTDPKKIQERVDRTGMTGIFS